MLLTTGPDSALCIAECLGTFIEESYLGRTEFPISEPLQSSSSRSAATFITRMNKVRSDFGMRGSSFNNATGLPDLSSYSTAEDIATLCMKLYDSKLGKLIVGTR